MRLHSIQRLLAKKIAEDLFQNNFGERAKRLVLESTKGQDLGGWCIEAVVDVIERRLKAERKGITYLTPEKGI
jgi:hypothetical protein